MQALKIDEYACYFYMGGKQRIITWNKDITKGSLYTLTVISLDTYKNELVLPVFSFECSKTLIPERQPQREII